MRRLIAAAAPLATLIVGPAVLVASPDPDVGGPTGEVQDLWAATPLDDEALAAAADNLTAWFERDGEHLLEQTLDFSFVESVALEDLRAIDVVGLAEVGWDPLEALSTDREGLDARLAEARGVLAVSPIRCSIDAVEARIRPAADLALEGSRGRAMFADQPYERAIVSGTRVASLDVDGALTRAILAVEVQVGSAELADSEAEIEQRWQLDLWLERTGNTTLRLRSVWLEASSPSFTPDSRAWMGWVLHEAFQDSEDWNRRCDEQPAGPPTAGTAAPPRTLDRTGSTPRSRTTTGPEPTPRATATPPPAPPPTATPSPIAARAKPPATEPPAEELPSPPPAPLCEGVQLIEVEPWALRNVETRYSSSDSIGHSEPENITVDQEAIDRWVEQGIRSWTPALGFDRHATIAPDEHARLRRLVERFGPKPRLLREESRARFSARWRMGLLREFLNQEPVLIPVCPAAMVYTAGKLGYATPEERARKGDDIEEIAAMVLLENGSVLTVRDEQWETMRQILAFGDAILRMMGRPDTSIDGKPEIDAVDSNL